MMIDQQLIDITEDFDDFLKKIVANYQVSYAGLVGVVMARMVVLAQISGGEDIMLNMIPYIENSLKGSSDGRIH
jgi:hypothetical protein